MLALSDLFQTDWTQGSEFVVRLSRADRRHRVAVHAAGSLDLSPIGEDLLWLVLVALLLPSICRAQLVKIHRLRQYLHSEFDAERADSRRG